MFRVTGQDRCGAGERDERREGRGVRAEDPSRFRRGAAYEQYGSDTRVGARTYDDLRADTRTWAKEGWTEGWTDCIRPQVCWSIGFAAAGRAELLPWWAGTVRGAGVGLYVREALHEAGTLPGPPPGRDPAGISRNLGLAAAHPQVGVLSTPPRGT